MNAKPLGLRPRVPSGTLALRLAFPGEVGL
jgi:hypothetical protein